MEILQIEDEYYPGSVTMNLFYDTFYFNIVTHKNDEDAQFNYIWYAIQSSNCMYETIYTTTSELLKTEKVIIL